MHNCEVLEEKMLKELETLEERYKGGQELSMNDLQKIDMLAHALKSLATYYAMKGEDYEMDGQSGRRGRNPMNGRYMSRDAGYSGYDYRPDGNSGYDYRPDPRQMPRW